MTRHRWAEPVRPDHHVTHRGCTRCGMCMTTRHEGPEHWAEFYRMPDGSRVFFGGAVPPCEPAGVMA